jgi:arylsulfatase A-like enzyme
MTDTTASLLLALVLVWAGAAASAAEPQPSVLVMIADDQGWGDLSCHGNSNLSTPHLDVLRQQGASFERFYVQPVCSPTRAELLTACYAPRLGVRGVTAGGERLDPTVPTVADAFQAAGYRTTALGKWHNGTQAPYHPLCRGFDSYYGFTSGHWANYFSPLLDRNGAITRGSGYLTDDVTNEAIQFMQQTRDRPFLVAGRARWRGKPW